MPICEKGGLQWVILLCDPDIAEFMQFSHEMNGETG